MKQTATKKLVLAALCVALGVVLPQAVHMVPNAGSVLLPMHLPVLLCGLAAGWPYGLAAGVLAPLLSSLFTSMPPAAILPSMACELAAYGLVSGLMARWVCLPRRAASVYVQLAAAMLAGRAVYGLMNALVFRAGAYSFQVFFTAAFVTALPGIALQLVLIPPILLLLQRAHVLEGRPGAVAAS